MDTRSAFPVRLEKRYDIVYLMNKSRWEHAVGEVIDAYVIAKEINPASPEKANWATLVKGFLQK